MSGEYLDLTMKFIILMVLATLIGACNTVEFYEKERLNDRLLVFDADPLASQMRQHMLTPREGSIGGFSSIGVGGCACK